MVQPLRHLQVVLVSNMIFSFNPFYFIFFCTAPSAPPENVTIIGSTPSSVDLLWDAPPFESQNGLIRRYIVEIRELETGLVFHLTTNSSNISVQNLLPFYNYTFAVAVETIAVGPTSNETIFMLPEGGKLSWDAINFVLKLFCFIYKLCAVLAL